MAFPPIQYWTAEEVNGIHPSPGQHQVRLRVLRPGMEPERHAAARHRQGQARAARRVRILRSLDADWLLWAKAHKSPGTYDAYKRTSEASHEFLRSAGTFTPYRLAQRFFECRLAAVQALWTTVLTHFSQIPRDLYGALIPPRRKQTWSSNASRSLWRKSAGKRLRIPFAMCFGKNHSCNSKSSADIFAD